MILVLPTMTQMMTFWISAMTAVCCVRHRRAAFPSILPPWRRPKQGLKCQVVIQGHQRRRIPLAQDADTCVVAAIGPTLVSLGSALTLMTTQLSQLAMPANGGSPSLTQSIHMCLENAEQLNKVLDSEDLPHDKAQHPESLHAQPPAVPALRRKPSFQMETT